MDAKFLFISSLLFLALLGTADAKSPLAQFKDWMKKYGKSYSSPAEFSKRFSTFRKNVKLIGDLNSKGNGSFGLSLNGFADLSTQEFAATYLAAPTKPTKVNTTGASAPTAFLGTLPTALDWRNRGVVQAVKNQGNCGSCWAFAAVSAVESLYAIKRGYLYSLSEQELVDCDYFDSGCKGGMPHRAMYFMSMYGIDTSYHYPYVGVKRTCMGKRNIVKISGYGVVPSYNDLALLQAVAQQPVTVAVDATYLQFYSWGIWNNALCNSAVINHAMVIVGYGTTPGGTKYWIVRNSWGSSWGEAGYARFLRGVNTCNINYLPTYPV